MKDYNDIDDVGVRKMMGALINITLKDLNSRNSKQREEAVAWLFGLRDYSIDFRTACHVCELSADSMLESLTKSGTVTEKEVDKVRKKYSLRRP
ncbi:MAG: hypothetical protein WDA47_03155 [Bacilli bacterium]